MGTGTLQLNPTGGWVGQNEKRSVRLAKNGESKGVRSGNEGELLKEADNQGGQMCKVRAEKGLWVKSLGQFVTLATTVSTK